MSPIRQEECCVDCDAYTGRAGASDDSLFLDDGRGPFCEFCYYRGRTEELEKELVRFQEKLYKECPNCGCNMYHNAKTGWYCPECKLARFKEKIDREKMAGMLFEAWGYPFKWDQIGFKNAHKFRAMASALIKYLTDQEEG